MGMKYFQKFNEKILQTKIFLFKKHPQNIIGQKTAVQLSA
jgi:hypothetical protein